MNFWTVLFLAAIIIVTLILILFPKSRVLFKGLMNLAFTDLATTPEGAKAIYGEKIEEAQDAYNKADNALRIASGKLATAKRDMENLSKRKAKVEAECEALVKSGNIDMARLKAEEREEILSDIQRQTELIKVYGEAAEAAKEAQEMCEKRLRKLKREKKEVVENMIVKKEIAKAYDDMDELKAVTETDKLLESVRDKNKDLDSFVEGSRTVHNNRVSTKLQKAEAEAKKNQSNDYLESLIKKHNK